MRTCYVSVFTGFLFIISLFQHPPRQSSGMFFSIHHQETVYEDVIDALGVLVRKIFKRVRVRVQVRSPVVDAFQIENHYISPGTHTEHTPVS